MSEGSLSFLPSSSFVDLTHVTTEHMPTWDEGHGFSQKQLFFADVDGYATHQLNFDGSGVGTHFDSAAHFLQGGRSVHEYPIKELISPAVVIDVSQQAERNVDYQITQQDVVNWEKIHGSIPKDSFVIAKTGWTKYWNDPKKYVGFDENKVRHFPGYGRQSARYLLEKGVRGLGIDTLSIDSGNDEQCSAHHVFLKANKYLVENINIGTDANNTIPELGATVFVMPIPILDCSGAPARVFAYH